MPPSLETLEAIVTAATRAPSSHNTQPWRFVARGRTIELWADRARRLTVNDAADRELIISCGAALFNLRVAAAHEGWLAAVALAPDRSGPDRLARLTLVEPASPPVALDRLYGQIGRRHTCRGPFTGASVPSRVTDALRKAARTEGGTLFAVPPEGRDGVALLVEEGDRLQWADPRWRRELASWMRAARAGDGLSVPLPTVPLTRAVVARLDLGPRLGRRDADLVREAPLLVVLTTASDHTRGWLTAGQALQRVLLTAADADLHAGFANQPCQCEDLRRRLAARLPEGGVPQLVLRIGRPRSSPRPSSRRAASEVLVPA